MTSNEELWPAASRVLLTDGGEEGEQEGETDEDEQETSEGEEGEQEEQAEEDAREQEGGEGEGEDEENENLHPGDESPATPDTGDETTIVFLDLKGLFLELLGLEVDLEPVVLEVAASPGDGDLLGNLLSAVVGLLDDGPSGLVPGGGLSGIFDGLLGAIPGFGGGDEEGEEGEEGEGGGSRIDAATDRAKGAVSSAVDDLPVEDLITQLISELVSQLLDGSGSSDEADGGESDEGEGSEEAEES
ncbi:hypothetical protein BRC93_13670 [Halobacteriales archaeon QS_5_70_15]|nr:MAG: hypothetical protein BRC93_13670 [Halobacteriales archaeon QS_5_70_15]